MLDDRINILKEHDELIITNYNLINHLETRITELEIKIDKIIKKLE